MMHPLKVFKLKKKKITGLLQEDSSTTREKGLKAERKFLITFQETENDDAEGQWKGKRGLEGGREGSVPSLGSSISFW